jgi:hypothetical protein
VRPRLRWTAVLPLAALAMFMTAQVVVPIGRPERALVVVYAGWQITVARAVSRRPAR